MPSKSAFLVAALVATLLALAPAAADASVNSALSGLQQAGQLDAAQVAGANKTYRAARSLRRRASADRRKPLASQIGLIESLARGGRLTADRVRPLFTQLQVNVDWFRSNGPAKAGQRSRFGRTSRIYYQYFSGLGWQFHPLANFAKLNAIWTDKSPAARRALAKYAAELIGFGVVRGGALTWEYYFPFAGSKAPFISSISQGTAIQSLARSGAALADPAISEAAARGAKAFSLAAPTGLRISRDGGDHFLGYSGNRRAIVFNMFAQALSGLHDYAKITGDEEAQAQFERGLTAARAELPRSDTGAWSLYKEDGAESSLHYHQVLVGFLAELCADSGNEAIFCELQARLASYEKQPPKLVELKKTVRRGRIRVSFTLSKISRVTLSTPGGESRTLTVGRGKRAFSIKKARSRSVTIIARDLAGNTVEARR
jgi:hypothetical protein